VQRRAGARHERPSDYAAAEKRKEFPPPHGFTPGPRIAERGYLNLKGYKEFARAESARRLEHLGHLCNLAGGTDAERPPRRMMTK
jgi:hypothetical protein